MQTDLQEKIKELPVDQNGAPMLPLAQFYLPALPYVPQVLDGRRKAACGLYLAGSHRQI